MLVKACGQPSPPAPGPPCTMRTRIQPPDHSPAHRPPPARPEPPPRGLTPAAVLAAQRGAGNAAVARMLARSPLENVDDGGSGTDPNFEKYLREGLARLDSVSFGRAEGVARGLPDAADGYDATYWTEASAGYDHGDGGAML